MTNALEWQYEVMLPDGGSFGWEPVPIKEPVTKLGLIKVVGGSMVIGSVACGFGFGLCLAVYHAILFFLAHEGLCCSASFFLFVCWMMWYSWREERRWK